MSMDRREFLKLAGFSTLAGMGGLSMFTVFRKGELEASLALQGSKALTAKKWAMVVDLAKFKTDADYQQVIHACHSIHNVPKFEDPKREVKWIWTDDYEHSFPGQENTFLPEGIEKKPFLLLCNHCDNPPCVRVCPTKATFKRADGIVMQDMHRCIGCRFCMAACPFGARSFNFQDPRLGLKKEEENPGYPTRMIGVVEKCTFCFERLGNGEIPNCVDKSNGGLIFGDITNPQSDVRKALAANYSIRRKVELGTGPNVYYIIGGLDHA